MKLPSLAARRLALILAAGSCILSLLGAEPNAGRSRIALFEPAGQKDDTTLAAVLSTVANSVELSLDVLQRYDVTRLPPEDPATDLDHVRAYCQKNRIDQAVLGSGSARAGGGYSFRLVVYDRKTDKITTDQQGASTGALDMFDVTDALVASLLDALSGRHLLYGSLSVESDPAGATISVNGKDVGAAPLSLRGLPVGAVELSARLDGYEGAKATVTIADGETTSSSLTLPRSLGVLAVAMPRDAVMTVGGATIQKKVIAGPGIAMLPAGDYDVEASCPGLPGVSAKVTIISGASTQWQPWAKGYLDVRSDPSGAAIVVDGVERGAAPLIVEVEPGTLHQVELRKQNYETYHAAVSGDAGNKTLFSGTLTPVASSPPPSVEPAVVVRPASTGTSHAVFKIEGAFEDWKNVGSWRGIQPLIDLSRTSPTFMGDARFAMAQVYMCRDDKNLYWRVDFAGTNPILRSPKGTRRAIDCELTVHFEPTKQIRLGAQTPQQHSTEHNKSQMGQIWANAAPLDAYGAIHDDATNRLTPLNVVEEVANSENAMVARIGLDVISQYCKGPVSVELKLGNQKGDGTWADSQVSETRMVDFSK